MRARSVASRAIADANTSALGYARWHALPSHETRIEGGTSYNGAIMYSKTNLGADQLSGGIKLSRRENLVPS